MANTARPETDRRPASLPVSPVAGPVQPVAVPTTPARIEAEPVSATSGKAEKSEDVPLVADAEMPQKKPVATLYVLPTATSGNRKTATSGTGDVKAGKKRTSQKTATSGTFSWDRVRTSKNNWAYRLRPSGKDPATGKRNKPFTVRYVSDQADKILERKGKDAIKKLILQWYEARERDRAGDRDRRDSIRAV